MAALRRCRRPPALWPVPSGVVALISYRVVDLISATTTDTGLTLRCELDSNLYPKGIIVSDEEIAALNIARAEFHGEWNYTIRPRNHPDRVVDS
jgi:hypothetical protein